MHPSSISNNVDSSRWMELPPYQKVEWVWQSLDSREGRLPSRSPLAPSGFVGALQGRPHSSTLPYKVALYLPICSTYVQYIPGRRKLNLACRERKLAAFLCGGGEERLPFQRDRSKERTWLFLADARSFKNRFSRMPCCLKLVKKGPHRYPSTLIGTIVLY